MNLEELTKSQIVLLTLLISFVTSMATGIVTVSLAEQGVSPVTNTVNKIVERTKEVVVKVQEPTEPLVIKEKVLVTETDQVAAAIAKNKDTSVAIYKYIEVEVATNQHQDEEGDGNITKSQEDTQLAAPITATDTTKGQESDTQEDVQDVKTERKLVFVARGLTLGGGLVATDASMLDNPEDEYIVITNSKEHVPATFISAHNDVGVALLSTDIKATANLADVDSLEHGQVVVVLSGTDRMRVIKTIIAEILTRDSEVVTVDTNASNISPGSILINLNGEVVGISTGVSRKNGKAWFTTINKIESVLPKATDANPE